MKFKPSPFVWGDVKYQTFDEEGAPLVEEFQLRFKRAKNAEIAKFAPLIVGKADLENFPKLGEEFEALIADSIVDWRGMEDAPAYSQTAFDEFCESRIGIRAVIGLAWIMTQSGARAKNSVATSASGTPPKAVAETTSQASSEPLTFPPLESSSN